MLTKNCTEGDTAVAAPAKACWATRGNGMGNTGHKLPIPDRPRALVTRTLFPCLKATRIVKIAVPGYVRVPAVPGFPPILGRRRPLLSTPFIPTGDRKSQGRAFVRAR